MKSTSCVQFLTGEIMLGALVALGITAACSKSPDQYQNRKPQPVVPILALTSSDVPLNPTNPNGGKIEGRVENVSAEKQDDQKREGSKEPILLGVGAAGITFNTTLQEARLILSEEQQIAEIDPFELHIYPEGIAVQWDKVSTQKPEMILIMNTYQGKLALPAKYADKEIKLGTSLKEFFTKEDPQAQGFVNDLYKYLQKLPAEADVDCFASGQCLMMPQPEARSIIYMIGSSSAIVLSDDANKALSTVLLTSNLPLLNFRDPNLLPPNENLTTEFDLLSGEMTDSEISTQMHLGDSYQQIPEILQLDEFTGPKIYLDQFQLPYRGGQLNYSRSSYARDYLRPKADERLQSIIITPAGSDAHDIGLTINGKDYIMRESGAIEVKRPKYKLEPGEAMPLPLGTKFYSKGFDQNRDVKAKFTRSMTEVMANAFKQELAAEAVADSESNIQLIPPTVSGIYSNEPITNYSGQTGYVDIKNQRGRIFEVLTTYNSITVIYSLSDITNMIDLNVIMERIKNAEIGTNSLAGFTIGQQVVLKDIDRALDQATLVVNGDSKRVSFNPNKTLKTMSIVATSGKAVEKNLNIAEVSMLGVTLGVSLDQTQVKGGDYTAQIVSIASSNFAAEIRNLCNLSEFHAENATSSINPAAEEAGGATKDSFKVHFGMSQNLFLLQLQKPEASECLYYTPSNPDAVKKDNVYYFPAKRAKVEFSDRQLSTVTIY